MRHQPESADNLRPSAARPARGGRRPGAGAPPGNLNALKHGLRSTQFARLGALLAANPTTRRALLDLAARHSLKQRRAEQVATLIFQRLLQRAAGIAERPATARLNDNPQPMIDAQSTTTPLRPLDPNSPDRPERAPAPPINQPPDTPPPPQSLPR